MEDYRDLISKNIRYFRKRQDITRADLARLTGLSNTYIAEIETGRKTPSLKVLIKIAVNLSTEPYRLLMDPEKQISESWESYSDELIEDITKLINQYKTRI